MRRGPSVPGIALLLAILVSPAGSEGEDHVYALSPETGTSLTFKDCYRQIAVTGDRPAGVRHAPRTVDAWLVFPWGEGEAVVAVTPEGLVPDRDGDGDLLEEDPLPHDLAPRFGFELDLALPSGPIRAKVELSSRTLASFRIKNLTRLSGTVRVGGREMAVSLTDYLANGRYDDYRTTKTPEYWLCDHIHLDRDADGEFRPSIPPRGEDHCLARAFVVGETLYECEVLDHGGRLRFEASTAPLFAVKANAARYTARFVSDELGCCGLPGPDGVGRLPAGRYVWDAYHYWVEGARVDGLFWPEDGLRFLEVRGDTELAIAGDLRYELEARLDEEGDLRFRTVCHGPLGARVMVWLDGSQSIKPELTVETDERELLYRVTSNYC